jgi:hypothetical protein
LLQPVAAVADMITDAKGYRRTVLRTAFNIFTPEVVISTASAAYGLAGLVAGSLVAQVLISFFGGFAHLVSPKRRNAISSFS